MAPCATWVVSLSSVTPLTAWIFEEKVSAEARGKGEREEEREADDYEGREEDKKI